MKDISIQISMWKIFVSYPLRIKARAIMRTIQMQSQFPFFYTWVWYSYLKFGFLSSTCEYTAASHTRQTYTKVVYTTFIHESHSRQSYTTLIQGGGTRQLHTDIQTRQSNSSDNHTRQSVQLKVLSAFFFLLRGGQCQPSPFTQNAAVA